MVDHITCPPCGSYNFSNSSYLSFESRRNISHIWKAIQHGKRHLIQMIFPTFMGKEGEISNLLLFIKAKMTNEIFSNLQLFIKYLTKSSFPDSGPHFSLNVR